MYRSSEQRLASLQSEGVRGLLKDSLKGLEKESLRVTPRGVISQLPHPTALGSALTHPSITTDYSEALLEFITAPERRLHDMLAQLDAIHSYVYRNIGDELLWSASMPCIAGPDSDIPIAEYGESNTGRMKHVYRRGLAWRYGRRMQAIAGIHFNYSFSQAFINVLRQADRSPLDEQAFRSEAYFGLIRNIQRYGWLIPVLFGASPALCKSFLGGAPDTFQRFDAHTLYEPWATSLRMSDVGYKNKAQAALAVSYNDLDSYVASLVAAMRTTDPDYARIGTCVDGEWRQLSSSILQIENEYYSFVRPKAVAQPGERPTAALKRAGVEYVEIRALDLDPFTPAGVGRDALCFIETLLVFCLLQDSPPIDAHELRHINHNQGLVARDGRNPQRLLRQGDGREVLLRDWALTLIDAMQGPATLLDELREGTPYAEALRDCRARIEDPNRTPSARVLQSMREHGENFIQFGLRVSKAHRAHFLAARLDPAVDAKFQSLAADSLRQQAEIEAAEQEPFETHLARYLDQL